MDYKWHPINAAAARQLSNATTAPGSVFSLQTSLLPHQLQRMHGVHSYYVSGYTNEATIASGLTLGGELLLIRSDESLSKAYNFVFASSSDGSVYYTGPFKDFSGHHFGSNQKVPIEQLFGHATLGSSSKRTTKRRRRKGK